MRCFVIQGFGSKTDLTDGRVLDLDASYAVIKRAVEAAGLECVRADEILHSGTIDVPMYEELLQADLVIADLSTYNVNAAFELGVRYALRPRATLVIAEEKFKLPFDVGHISVWRYKHLGEDIGNKEAQRIQKELGQLIQAVVSGNRTDSPVYTMVGALQPPSRQITTGAPAPQLMPGDPLPAPAPRSAPASSPPLGPPIDAKTLYVSRQGTPKTAKEYMEEAQAAMQSSKFAVARDAWAHLRTLNPQDAHVVQMLALSTYKAKEPNEEAALLAAKQQLLVLSPATTNDPETLGQWGAIHKRLWKLRRTPDLLEESIQAYERGYFLKQDYYNGINLAFQLDQRAVEFAEAGQRDEAVADAVRARRIRREVVTLVTSQLKESRSPETRYWLLATQWEACLGLKQSAEIARLENELTAMSVPDWMQETRRRQGRELGELLARYEERMKQI